MTRNRNVALCSAAIMAVLALGYVATSRYGKTKAIRGTTTLPSSETAEVKATIAPVWSQDLEQSLLSELRQSDLRRKKFASSQVHLTVLTYHDRVLAGIDKWITPLSEAGQYRDILDLTSVSTSAKPHDVNWLSDQLDARVDALLITGDNSKALEEARTLLRVSPQKTFARSLAKVIRAERAANGSEAAFRIEQELIKTGALPAWPDNGPLMIADVSSVSLIKDHATTFDQIFGNGNIFLAVGQLDRAKESFQAAMRLPGIKGKRLFAAIEGLIKVRRAESHSIITANQAINALRHGAIDSPVLNDIHHDMLKASDAVAAGKSIPFAALPPELKPEWESRNDSLTAENGAGALKLVVELFEEQKFDDPALHAWLINESSYSRVTDDQLSEFAVLLKKSPLPPASLLKVISKFSEVSDQPSRCASLIQVVADRGHQAIVSDQSSDEAVNYLAALIEYRPVYKPILWNKIGEGDEGALSALTRMYSDYFLFAKDDKVRPQPERPSIAIGLAECLILTKHPAEATEIMSNVDWSKGRVSEQKKAMWVKGWALSSNGDLKAAIPNLKAAAVEKSEFSRNAAETLCFVYSKLGDIPNANSQVKAVVDEYKLNPDDAARLRADVSAASIKNKG